MIKERLERLRRKMYENGLDAYYFNTQDTVKQPTLHTV